MVTRRRFLTLVGVGVPGVALAAAGIRLLPSEVAPTGDPNLRFGEATCERCGMVIGDPRFAAAWREHDTGREAYFDDIGCMAHEAHDRAIARAEMFAGSYRNETWLNVEDAYFVIDGAYRTPMAYDIAAFASKHAATESPGGHTVMRWDELKPALDRATPKNGHGNPGSHEQDNGEGRNHGRGH